MLAELDEHRRKHNDVKRKIRDISPELDSLRYPKAIDLTATQQMLDPGTLLLSYYVMEDRTAMFVVRKNEKTEMITIFKGQKYLEERIKCWTQLTTDPKAGKISRKIFEETSLELYRLLIKPVQAKIKIADRVVILPDKALWKLPFGALQLSKQGERRRYLIEETPISTIVSASLLKELKQHKKRGISKMAAFGEPVYPHAETWIDTIQARLGTMWASRYFKKKVFRPLPYTAVEIEEISPLFDTRTFLRKEATESQAKKIGKQPNIIHFACHGGFYGASPLDSWLALTINPDFQAGEENGILHAWEIIEDLRIDADLVVLSACESGLGKVSGGEGLVGLTRAFQFAGARSIVASWWQVNDATTAVFMKKFYTLLNKGLNKDEALRRTQIELINNQIHIPRTGRMFFSPKRVDASHPYYWAAFQLIGPWD